MPEHGCRISSHGRTTLRLARVQAREAEATLRRRPGSGAASEVQRRAGFSEPSQGSHYPLPRVFRGLRRISGPVHRGAGITKGRLHPDPTGSFLMSHTPLDAGGVVYLKKRYIQREAGGGIRAA